MRHHLLARLSRQALLTGDPALAALSAELASSPGGPPGETAGGFEPIVTVRLRSEHGELSPFSTIATFGAPADITVSETRDRDLHPVDAPTAGALRALLPPS